MVLSNSGGLFQNEGLYQSDGDLPERWGQQGSNIFNLSTSSSNDAVLYTVPAGKVLLITDMIISDSQSFRLRDGGSGGDEVFRHTGQSYSMPVQFKTPLKFETDIYYEQITSTNINIVFTGWEE